MESSWRKEGRNSDGKGNRKKGKKERREKKGRNAAPPRPSFPPPPLSLFLYLSRNDDNQTEQVGSAAASVKSGRKCVNPHWLVPWLLRGQIRLGRQLGSSSSPGAESLVGVDGEERRGGKRKEEGERERREKRETGRSDRKPPAARKEELLPMLSILPFLFSLSPHSRRLSSIFLVTHLCALKRTHPHIDRVVVAPAPSRAGGSEEKRRRSTAASETSRRRAFQWRFFPGTVPSHLLRSSQANERIAVPLVPLYRARMRARERGRGRRE